MSDSVPGLFDERILWQPGFFLFFSARYTFKWRGCTAESWSR